MSQLLYPTFSYVSPTPPPPYTPHAHVWDPERYKPFNLHKSPDKI